MARRAESEAPVTPAIGPRRLLDRRLAANYLGMSVAAFDALRSRGHIASTPVPSAHRVGAASRTPLFDLHDLDAAIERWKAEGVS